LLGIPSSTSTTYGSNTHTFAHSHGFYVTDTFQLTPKLSVIAGIRWEQPGAYSEEQNLSVVLQPNAPVSVCSLNSITNPVTGSSVPLTGQLAFVDSPHYSSRRQEELHWELYSPRLGLAYRIDPKTVVRSGYGISFLPADMDQAGPQLSQVVRAATSNTNTFGQPLQASIANPLPNGVNKPLGRSQPVLNSLLGVGLWALESNVPYGYTQQWNLAVERQLNQNSTLTVAYAGAKGTHLLIATPYTGSSLISFPTATILWELRCKPKFRTLSSVSFLQRTFSVHPQSRRATCFCPTRNTRWDFCSSLRVMEVSPTTLFKLVTFNDLVMPARFKALIHGEKC